ncbi:hypothetical protein B0A52_05457 [Exophiala mesophila]|uniref:Phosphomevalonate kinase n=1 Tax=Exophiala mesophila TaxID=212818 RepID=A0A438N4Y8_EXOME|nr:hypothetical protein B0A52_05457 [Exophiala mesophila]
MSASKHPKIAVSAPGKVLFAGGFLVLDRLHTGLVFGLDARIHVCVERWEDCQQELGKEGSGLATSQSHSQSYVQVTSPQFRDARWAYRVSENIPRLNQGKSTEDGRHVSVDVSQIIESNSPFTTTSNKFVETTLRYALTYLSHRRRADTESSPPSQSTFQNLKIAILADDDYYSQSAGSSQPQDSNTGFSDFGVTLSQAHKTGLGSSAALVTALAGALLAFHSSNTSTPTALDLTRLHNLAQAAHCAAQGKIGSGFDVAAAVYGSCLYRRFSPSILEALGEASSADFGERLHLCVDDLNLEGNKTWDVQVKSGAVQVPSSLMLIMCDVDCGSETPGMVRKVLKWRSDNPDEAGVLWTALQLGQEDLCVELARIAEREGLVDPEEAKANAVADADVEQQFTRKFQPLADIISTIRSLVREMSTKSAVPIEPPVITELLDFCTSLPGVVGGVAPGAGGYDAVALLVRNDPDVVKRVQNKLEGWKTSSGQRTTSGSGNVGDDVATIGRVRLLGVKQEKEGVRMEGTDRYHGWT